MSFAPQHILVPVAIDPDDDFKLAHHAFVVACDIAAKFSAKITLLHLTTPLVIGTGPGVDVTGKIYESFLSVMETRHVRGKLKLKELEEEAKSKGLNIESRVVDGLESTARAIVDVAKHLKVDLVVMGSHGRKGLSKLLFGSVAEQVAQKSAVPVLLLHPDREV